MIKAITLDLDDTLWEVWPTLIAAEKTLHQWLNNHCPDISALLADNGLMSIRQRVLSDEPDLMHRVSEMRLRVLEQALLKVGYSPSWAQQAAQSAFEVFLEARHQVTFYPLVIDVLDNLSRNYRLAALSNGNANVYRLGLGKYFSFGLNAEMVGIGKPHPAMFEQALEKLELRADQVIHVGDNPTDDVIGAQQLGMHTVWVNPEKLDWPTDNPSPNAEIECMEQLPASIEFIISELINTEPG
ncbi:MAG: HAD-IA family hydrolase [Pseudomonadales bacterium]|nr:HAD-IA family hydrolase [Pseudomonadales bacterium]